MQPKHEVKLPGLPPTYNGPDDPPQFRRVFCPKCQMFVEYDASLFADYHLPCGH
jgi:hypothetical protein